MSRPIAQPPSGIGALRPSPSTIDQFGFKGSNSDPIPATLGLKTAPSKQGRPENGRTAAEMNGGGLPGTLPVIGQGQRMGGRAGIAGAAAPSQQSALQPEPAAAAGETPIKIPTIEDILPGWGGRFPGTVSMMENFKASQEAERAMNLGYGDRFNSWLMLGGLNKLMGENCLFKGAIALGGGWALGGMFGAFLAPFDTMGGLRVRPPQTHCARVWLGSACSPARAVGWRALAFQLVRFLLRHLR